MAFAASGLQRAAGGLGTSGVSIWTYTTTDAHTDVDATDYFTAMKTYGMKLYDIVYVIDTDTATTTTHHVSAIDSDGNVTISAATLA